MQKVIVVVLPLCDAFVEKRATGDAQGLVYKLYRDIMHVWLNS